MQSMSFGNGGAPPEGAGCSSAADQRPKRRWAHCRLSRGECRRPGRKRVIFGGIILTKSRQIKVLSRFNSRKYMLTLSYLGVRELPAKFFAIHRRYFAWLRADMVSRLIKCHIMGTIIQRSNVAGGINNDRLRTSLLMHAAFNSSTR